MDKKIKQPDKVKVQKPRHEVKASDIPVEYGNRHMRRKMARAVRRGEL